MTLVTCFCLSPDQREESEPHSVHSVAVVCDRIRQRIDCRRLTLEVPRCKDGSFSTKLFARYQRSEKALVLALMEMVIQGVSTRRVKKITTELCGREFTKSTVSRLTKRLDEQVEAWAGRELEGEYPFVIFDAMHVEVRRQQAVRSTAVLMAIGINEHGQREILGLHVALSETADAWSSFLQRLKDRGLSGVEHVTSDRDRGLQEAIQAELPGAIWTPCHAHLRRNILDDTPDRWREAMKDLLDEVLDASSQPEAWRIFEEILDGERQRMMTVVNEEGETEEIDSYGKIRQEAASALATLEENLEDATAVLALPGKYRRRLRTTNMLERLIEEVRRREKVIRIFPNMDSAWRLVGALLAEYHEEWSTGRKYLDMTEYHEWKEQASELESPPTQSRDDQPTIAA